MKYMLQLYMDPEVWDSLTEEERNAVYRGHEAFQQTTTETGEFIRTEALAEPEASAVVRVRDGVAAVTRGPVSPSAEFLCGHYIVECASEERAIELAGLVPDAQYTQVEVRPIVHESGRAS